MFLLAQAAVDAVPSWVGMLSGSALSGVLLYYLLTVQIPKTQALFHEEQKAARDAFERVQEKTLESHRQSIEKLIEHDEDRHEKLMARIDRIQPMA